MPFKKQGNFTFNHSEQQDDLYRVKEATEIKQDFDSRGEELKDTVNTLIDDLTKTTAGESGAKNIGVSTIEGVAGNDVQTVLQKLKEKDDAASEHLTGLDQSVGQLQRDKADVATVESMNDFWTDTSQDLHTQIQGVKSDFETVKIEVKGAAESASASAVEAQTQAAFAEEQGAAAKQRLEELNGLSAVQFKDRQDQFDAQLAETTAYIHLASFKRISPEVNDNPRIMRAIEAAKVGDTIYLRNESTPYEIADTVLINKQIHFLCDNDVIYSGTRDRPAFLFQGQVDSNIRFKTVSDKDSYDNYQSGYHGWTNFNYAGIVFENLKSCVIHINEVRNFTVGVKCKASGGKGFWFNEVIIKSLRNNKQQLELNQDGTGSWMNSNNFYGTSPSYSGSSFITSVADRYSIVQTLTNGNVYKSNSNNFHRWKFETGDTFSGTWTQVNIKSASGWKFLDYRYEITKDVVFAVIDLAVNSAEYNTLSAHTDAIEFKPLFVLGINHKITFINNSEIKGSYSQVAKIIGQEDKYLLAFENGFRERYRRYTENHHIIKGIVRKPIDSKSLTAENVYDYSGSELLLANGVNLTGAFPAVFYITNLKTGDEITFEGIFSSGTPDSKPLYKAFDKTDVFIEEGKINGARVLALEGSWTASNSHYTPAYNRNVQKVTINHDNVGTLAVLIYGQLAGFKLHSSNPSNLVKKTVNTFLNKHDRVFVHAQPTRTINGYFMPEDVVFNTNSATGQVIGWKLSAGTWQSVGTY